MQKIRIYPDPILTTPTKKATRLSQEVLQLIDDLVEVMDASDGIGLAANQLGSTWRVAVVEVDEETGLFEMINPEIVTVGSKKNSKVEGCLSFPDIYGKVERFDEVTVRYVDREGYEVEVDTSAELARAMQHEIDHLDGILFIDKIIERIKPEELELYREEESND
ncbi:peptide deformylase [Vagococcus sp.]|uniref:peptide deformylase n=1 Tax=Vagococcus sp. TaxID=1933889 RepID=UPI003F952C0A